MNLFSSSTGTNINSSLSFRSSAFVMTSTNLFKRVDNFFSKFFAVYFLIFDTSSISLGFIRNIMVKSLLISVVKVVSCQLRVFIACNIVVNVCNFIGNLTLDCLKLVWQYQIV